MIRKRVEWKFRGSSLTLGERTLIVGILNVTPDSFSDGGRYDDPDLAMARALDMQGEGADLLDIGAESTKPGAEPVSEAEELRRLIPVLKRLKGKLDIPISVDTYKPAVAETALEHGASIINDVSGLLWEPELAKSVRDADAGLILSHTRGRPEEWARLAPMRDVMGEIAADLEASVHRARRAGVELDHIVIDPGVGFGKRKEQNSELLARLGELRRLLLPILVGPSRKSFLNQEDPRLLEFATAGAVATAILNGAALVRVHDVAAMKVVAATADAVIDAMPDREEEARPRRTAREAVKERALEEAERKKPVRPPLIGGVKKAAEPAPGGGERPAYSRPPREQEGERPPAQRRERPSSGAREDRPSRNRDDRPMRGREDRPQRTRDDRPLRGRDDRPTRSREDRPTGGREDRPFRGRDDRPVRSRDERATGGREDRPFRGRDDRPVRSRDDRASGGREDRPFRGRDDRPPRGRETGGQGTRGRDERPTRGRDSDRPPLRGKRDDERGGRPSFRDRKGPPREGGGQRGPGGGPRGGGSRGPKGPGSGGPRGGGGGSRGPSTPRRRG